MSAVLTVKAQRVARAMGERFGAEDTLDASFYTRLRRTARGLHSLGGARAVRTFITALSAQREGYMSLCCAEELADGGWDVPASDLLPAYREDAALQDAIAQMLEGLGAPYAPSVRVARVLAQDRRHAIDVLQGRLRLNYHGEWTRDPWDP